MSGSRKFLPVVRGGALENFIFSQQCILQRASRGNRRSDWTLLNVLLNVCVLPFFGDQRKV